MVAAQPLAAVRAVRHRSARLRRSRRGPSAPAGRRARRGGRPRCAAPRCTGIRSRALAREHVLVAGRVLLVAPPLEDAVLDQRVEPGAQHVAGDAEPPLPVVEAGDAEERRRGRSAASTTRPPPRGSGRSSSASPRTRLVSRAPRYQLHDATDSARVRCMTQLTAPAAGPPALVDPRRAVHVAGAHHHRHHHPERGHPHALPVARHRDRRAAVDRRRLHGGVRRAAAHLRQPRRPLGPPAHARHRAGRVRHRLRGVGAGRLGDAC